VEKTKLGLSIGFVGALLYCLGLFGGILVTIAAVGYVLICEENEWLKKTAVKVVVLMLLFPIVIKLIGIVPDLLSLLGDFLGLFKVVINLNFIYAVENLFRGILNIIEYMVFAVFGVLALFGKTIRIPLLDSFIDKHIG
jgi:uncharacterized membrane protein